MKAFVIYTHVYVCNCASSIHINCHCCSLHNCIIHSYIYSCSSRGRAAAAAMAEAVPRPSRCGRVGGVGMGVGRGMHLSAHTTPGPCGTGGLPWPHAQPTAGASSALGGPPSLASSLLPCFTVLLPTCAPPPPPHLLGSHQRCYMDVFLSGGE